MDQQHSVEHADDQARAAEALGFATAFEACAAAFLNEPDEALVEKVRLVAQAVGDHGFDDVVADADLKQRYADRVFVASSPYHVPLLESCIAGSAADEHGVVRYGPSQSNRGDHVFRCYKALQFDIDGLPGSPVAVKSLKADSLAAELAFLAFMKGSEAASLQMGDRASAKRWHEFARTFAREHANAWVATAAKWLALSDDDFYAKACDLAAETVAAVAKEEL